MLGFSLTSPKLLAAHLSKAFDCILHGLIIPKLNAVSFDKRLLSIISAYLYKENKKLGSEFSNFLNILFGISQESILRPVSIIFIADLFFINNDIDFVS